MQRETQREAEGQRGRIRERERETERQRSLPVVMGLGVLTGPGGDAVERGARKAGMGVPFVALP